MLKKNIIYFLSNKLFSTASLSLIGSVLIRAVDLISIPIFTRLLDTATYGRVSVFTTYVQIFMIILSLDFKGCVARASLEFQDQKEKFYSVSLFFSMLWSGIIIFLFNIFHNLTEQLLAMSQLEYNVMLIYSFTFFVINYKSSEYIFEMQYIKNIFLSMTVALGNLILSVLLVLTLFDHNRFLGRIIGAAIPTVIIGFFILAQYQKRGKSIWNKQYINYALKFGVPLVPHSLCHMILANSDRIMIQSMISNSASGIYSLTYNVGLMMQVITEGTNNVWSPLLLRQLDKNERTLIKYQARLYLIGYTIVAILIIGISPEIIKIIASSNYWQGIDFVMWICLATYFTFVYQLFVNVEFYHKSTILISIGTVLATLINIILNLYGLPIWGYEFAAISTVISYGALVIFHCFILNYILKDHVIDNIFTLSVAGLVLIMTMLLHLLRYHIWMRFFGLIFMETVLILFGFIVYKKSPSNSSNI